ncbi:MAG: MerR family transcriptional regulator [Candidatus Promineifilaceae bacterium]|jgi:methanogenic corrinoid protein MtbC1
MPDEQIPTYNLKVVLKQTGLKADTLRAWERRYGLPNPGRSAGRHRLYSQRDIDTIKWLRARQGEGMSISNAVELWMSLEDEGNDPLLMEEFATPSVAAPRPTARGGQDLEELRDAWIAACSNFDESASASILSEAFALFAVEDVCLQVILDGMHHIGQGWYEGDVAVEQEHFASAIAKRQLEALVSAAPAPTRPEKIVVGAAPGDLHDLALLMITLLLKRRGWDVIYLGANVPLESYAAIFDSSRFDLAIISAEQLFTVGNLYNVASLAQQAGIPLLFGGRIFREVPDLRNRIPGTYLGERLEAVPGVVARGFSTSFPDPDPVVIDETYHNALVEFEEQSPRIELSVRQVMGERMPPEALELANLNFSRDIQAALILGDLNFVPQELEWIKGLINNRGLPASLLSAYLNTYTQAALEHLVENGQLVVNWLQQLKINE